MTKRPPVGPALGPLEEYAARFGDLFGARAQRHALRRDVEGLLLPAERNKTLTAPANTEPAVGAQRKDAQSLQRFLSQSGWNLDQVNRRRVELLVQCPSTAPGVGGGLLIDEHADRKWGKKTAHVGRQWLANIGKADTATIRWRRARPGLSRVPASPGRSVIPRKSHRDSCFSSLDILRPGFFRSTDHLTRYDL